MKFALGAALSAMCLLGPRGNAAENWTLEQTRSTVRQWVETEQLISRTQADWMADKETLGQTVAMYEAELEALAKQSSGVSTNVAQITRERGIAEAGKAEFEAGLKLLEETIGGLEGKLKEASAAFPSPLTGTVQSLLDRLPEDSASSKKSPVQRLQTVVMLMNEVEKFNSTVTLNPEMRSDPAGGEVKVQVIYFGLGQAYYVDQKGKFSGVGRPGANGWEWTSAPRLATDIRSTIAMYEEKEPAVFVSLPVEVK